MRFQELVEAERQFFSYDQIKNIDVLNKQGVPSSEIALKFSVRRNSITAILKKIDTILRVADLYIQGYEQEQIAATMLVSKQYVKDTLQQYLHDLQKNRIDDEQEKRQRFIDQIGVLYAQGFSHPQIAEKLKTTDVIVGHVIKKNFQHLVKLKKEERDNLRKKALELYKQGIVNSKIADMLGVSPGLINNLLYNGPKRLIANNPLRKLPDDNSGEELIKKIGDLYVKKRMKIIDISREVGRATNTVHKIINQFYRDEFEKRKEVRNQNIDRAKTLRISGKTMKQIADIIGISENSVSYWFKTMPNYEEEVLPLYIQNREKLWATSKEEIDFFNTLEDSGIKMNRNKRIQLEGRFYYTLDGVDEDAMVIVEYFGDRWHCNPSNPYYIEHADEVMKLLDLTPRQVWEKDKRKVDTLTNLGYNVIVVWGENWKKKQNQQKIIATIKKAILNKK